MKRVSLHVVRNTLLSASLAAVLGACNRTPPADAANAANAPGPGAGPASAASAAPTPAPGYVPPTADQLYALVSPIALFPDKLVALTLAGSTHPDQVDAARSFLGDNRNLTGGALIDAADAQPWDPSVKSLVAFPAVLDQLSTNRDWTAALGDAYANEPTDVLNAIQAMRERACTHGSLKSSKQQVVRIDQAPPPRTYTTTTTTETSIVPAPTRTIVIEPAQSDVVYVPHYDPDVVYGAPVYSTVYRTHWYQAPATTGDVVATGLVSFGAGILVGQLFASHAHYDRPHGGWNEWNTSWGGGPRYGGYDGGYGGRPAVVYDNHPYVVNRTTINRTVNNNYVNRSVNIDNRHDFGNVDNRHDNGNLAMRSAPQAAQVQAQAQAAQARQRPDFEHMQRPNFTAAMARPTAANARPELPAQARVAAAQDPRGALPAGARPGQPLSAAFATTHAGDPAQARGMAHAMQANPTTRDNPVARANPGAVQASSPGIRPQVQDPRVANVHDVGARARAFDADRVAREQAASRPQARPPQEARPEPQREPAAHAQPERMQVQREDQRMIQPSMARSQPRPEQRPEQRPPSQPQPRNEQAHERPASRPPQHESHAPAHRDEHDRHDG
ncbi:MULTISPECIES: DUF3300 domain-containing protein [unclassified Luteibacter]|uniref:DUF3300 domain-containing protein n=1 Tax=Luteibacter sp. PvP019 TaxID=3156436 RepID=UPI003390B66F